MFEADFRCSDGQRLAVVPVHLPPQDVEVVGGGRALGHLEIDVLAAEVVELATDCVVRLRVHILQESLHVTGGMLRACTIETVRQKQD